VQGRQDDRGEGEGRSRDQYAEVSSTMCRRRLQGSPWSLRFRQSGYKIRPMRPWIAGALLVLLPVSPAAAEISVQEALLRAKPAVALVIAEVSSEVVLTCSGGGEKRIRPAPFRETGSGWFLSPSGWLLTNAHVVSAARNPPAWVADQQARRAVREACGELSPDRKSTRLNSSHSQISYAVFCLKKKKNKKTKAHHK